MSLECELLDAIRHSLDDDAPRLVYADHLQRRGDPRGEFIALDIATGCGAEAARWQTRDTATWQRRDELLAEHAEAWGAPLLAHGGVPGHRPHDGYHYVRGFVEHLVYVHGNLDDLGELLRLEPLRSFEVCPADPDTHGSLDAPAELAWIRAFRISRSSEVAAAILASPHLHRVEYMALGELDPELATAVARGTARPGGLSLLSYERRDHPVLDDISLATLAGCGVMANLEFLGVGSVDGGALAAVPMPALRSFTIWNHGVDEHALAPLRAHLAQLTKLELHITRSREAGLRRFLARTLRADCELDLRVVSD